MSGPKEVFDADVIENSGGDKMLKEMTVLTE